MTIKGKTKVCSKCKKEKKLSSDFYYHKARKTYMSSCKDCNNKRVTSYYKEIKTNPTPQTVFQRRACDVYRRCRNKNIPYDKNLGKHLTYLWEQNKGKCYYTNRHMTLTGYHTDANAVTIDRIIPEKGYIKGNIVLCCSMANRVKQDMEYSELIKFCKEIIKNEKKLDLLTK